MIGRVCVRHPHLGGERNDGHRCPACLLEYNAGYAARKKEVAKAYHSGNKQKIAATKRAWVLSNKDKVRRYSAVYKLRNRDAINAANRKRAKDNPEAAAKAKARYLASAEEHAVRSRKWAAENRDRVRAINAGYRARNREALNAARVQHAKDKPEIAAKAAAKRRAACAKATPKWVNDFFMEEAYSLAKIREVVCGGAWHVDHIVPLRAKLACGLHAHTNIQVIRAEINRAKGNRYA